jgi:hypothetical protein
VLDVKRQTGYRAAPKCFGWIEAEKPVDAGQQHLHCNGGAVFAAIHQSASSRQDAPPVCLLTENPHRLVSLWDIVNQFKAADFCLRVGNLAVFEARFQYAKPADVEDWAQLTIEFAGQVIHIANDCHDVGLTDAWEEINRINTNAGLHQNDPTAQVMAARQIRHCVVAHLSKRAFLYVAPDRTEYVDAAALFGSQVKDAFPSAAFDILESGNCLACEIHTAAVFHLMRVAEIGLRAFARDRRVKLPKRGQPLELATWEEILKKLEEAETVIQTYPKTLALEAQFEFVHGTNMQFKRFKNVFRNRVMHTREEFGRAQALGVFENVRDFMQTLAFRISENSRTPLIWKGSKWTVTPAR